MMVDWTAATIIGLHYSFFIIMFLTASLDTLLEDSTSSRGSHSQIGGGTIKRSRCRFLWLVPVCKPTEKNEMKPGAILLLPSSKNEPEDLESSERLLKQSGRVKEAFTLRVFL